MRALIFSISLLAAGWVSPSASADASVRDGVLSQCATTTFDAATCARLARIAGELVDSEVVSDALAAEVANLPVDQGEWLAQALDAQASAAEYEQDEIDVLGDRDDDVFGSSDTPSSRGGEVSEPPAPPPPPRQSTLLRALEKARDYIRRAISGRG